MEHADREMAAAARRGRGDGVVARSHGWQQLQVDIERQVAAGEVVQQLEHRPPTGCHPFAIGLPACLVEAGHGLQLLRLFGIGGVPGQHGKITSAGDVLQLDAGAEDAKQRRGFSQRKVVYVPRRSG